MEDFEAGWKLEHQAPSNEHVVPPVQGSESAGGPDPSAQTGPTTEDQNGRGKRKVPPTEHQNEEPAKFTRIAPCQVRKRKRFEEPSPFLAVDGPEIFNYAGRRPGLAFSLSPATWDHPSSRDSVVDSHTGAAEASIPRGQGKKCPLPSPLSNHAEWLSEPLCGTPTTGPPAPRAQMSKRQRDHATQDSTPSSTHRVPHHTKQSIHQPPEDSNGEAVYGRRRHLSTSEPPSRYSPRTDH
ncbi:hypothetical protein C8Q78DRAFT_1012741 [Trametes maxima]|nr:hypothetical protein C8Q78DRAFT_1012741 [Trametes maxima]